MRILIPVALLLNAIGVGAQESPYTFNWKKELIYASGAGLFAGGGLFARYQVRPLTETQIHSLDVYALPGLDRSVIGNWNADAALVSDVMLYSCAALPALMMLNRRARQDFLVVGFMYAEAALLTMGMTEFVKASVKRPRPFAYDPEVDMGLKTTRSARFSFFSGHTSLTTAMCFTTAKIFSDYSDNPIHEALVWTGAATFPLAMASLRMTAGKHFPSDVIAGYLVGGAVGYLVPWLHMRKPVVPGLSFSPYTSGRNELGIYLNYKL